MIKCETKTHRKKERKKRRKEQKKEEEKRKKRAIFSERENYKGQKLIEVEKRLKLLKDFTSAAKSL